MVVSILGPKHFVGRFDFVVPHQNLLASSDSSLKNRKPDDIRE